MAIMKWNTPPKGTAEDRRAHVVGHGDNVALQHTAFGDKVPGNAANITNLNPNYAQASRWLSTAPYRGDEPVAQQSPPKNPYGYRDASRQGKCMANDDTCNGNATIASGRKWCYPHSKVMEKQEPEPEQEQ